MLNPNTILMPNQVFSFVNNYIEQRLNQILDGSVDYLINSKRFPNNPISGTNYKGFNLFSLFLIQEIEEFHNNQWATFKQLSDQNYMIKPKEKGSKILFYKAQYIYKNKIVPSDFAQKLIEQHNTKELYFKPIYKYYTVFNFCQLDENTIEDLHQENAIIENHSAEKCIEKNNASIELKNVDIAYYTPSTDIITLPLKYKFIDSETYYAVLFHELSHWAINQRRLNINVSNKYNDYAFEELIAEISSAYLCVYFNIKSRLKSNTIYINTWLKALKKEERFFFDAAGLAQKVFNYIIT